MKKKQNNKIDNQQKKDKHSPSRRRFIKKVGIGVVATAAYSVVSLSQLSCSNEDSPTSSNFDRGGYAY
jgi:hypothetical protein